MSGMAINRKSVIYSRKSALIVALLGSVAAGAVTPASAQILEEIIVTAQKREQSSQDVGIAITAFTGDQMKALGITRSFDIASYAPGVHISGNLAGQNTQFSIRGVTQNDFNDIIEAPNAVYLDEGYIAVAQAQTFAVFDIERVEILKGPQGTLFGRNATGGLIHYFSRKPNFDEAEGYIDVTYGRFDSPAHADQIRLEGAVGGPLGENFAVRLAFMYNWHQGYLKNLYPDGALPFLLDPGPGAGADLGDDDTLAGRGTIAWRASDNIDVTVSFNAARSNLATGPYQSKPTIGIFNANNELINVIDIDPGETRLSIALAADGSDVGADFGSDLDNNGIFGAADPVDAGLGARFGPGGDFFGYRDPDGEDFTFSGDFAFANSGNVDTWGINAKIEWDMGNGTTLTSITDYKSYEKLLFIDVDAAPVNQAANYAGVDATSFTQELRLNGETDTMRWLAGLYYLHINNDSDNGLKFPNGSIAILDFATFTFGNPFDLGVDAKLKTNSYSVFGQIEYDLTAKMTLIAGGRLIQEEKDYRLEHNIYGSPDARLIHQGAPLLIGPIGFGQAFEASSSDTLWAGKLQLDYHASDDLLLYGGINRGVKAGSFNAQLAGGLPIANVADVIPYKEEILWAYEAGFKATLMEGRARLNGSVFYYDYKDYQAFLFTGVGGIVINADADNIGAELELQVSPAEGWDALLSVAWFDATVRDVPFRTPTTAAGLLDENIIVSDVNPVYAPEFQVSGMLRYEWQALGGRISVMGDFSYSDSYFYNLRNFDADQYSSYLIVNARVGWISASDQFEAALKITNLTDDRAGIQGFDLATLCGCNEISFQPPRWYGITLGYKF